MHAPPGNEFVQHARWRDDGARNFLKQEEAKGTEAKVPVQELTQY